MTRKLLLFLPAVLLTAFHPDAVAAEEPSAGIRLAGLQAAGGDFSTTESTETDFTVRPSVTSSSIGAGEQTLDLVVFCVDLTTGEILPNCDVEIDIEARPGSGGHEHFDPNRPAGKFDPDSGNTGSDGFLETTYTAPEVSGIMDGIITGTTEDGTPLIPTEFTIGVRIPGLVGLAISGDGFTVNPSVGHGNNNRFATSAVVTDLGQVPLDFRAELLAQGVEEDMIPTLFYTSIGLPHGGLFDVDASGDGIIDNPWGPPHRTHRFGNNADLRIRNVPAEFRDELETVILNLQFRMPVEGERPQDPDSSHWHLIQ